MKKWVLIFLLAAVLPGMVLAQGQTSGTISGRVTDEEGQPISGADITVSSTQLGIERTSQSDDGGLFTFAKLPVGFWTVTIEAAEFQPQVYSFRLGVGENVPVNVSLLRGEVAEEITVYSTSTALQQVSTQTNFDYREQIEELPHAQNARDINLVARLAAQTSENVQTGNSISIAGAPSIDTTVLLDGAEISDPFFGTGVTVYLEDAIEEVQVLTSGVSARYGRFQGGIINAITKSGSNEFEATVRYEFDKDSWNSQTPFEEVQNDELDEVYQATAGGYFWKDHIWFFGGYREIPATTIDRTTGFTGESFIVSSVEDRWQGKIRFAPVANHVIDVSHLEFEATTDPWSATNLLPGHLQTATVGKRGDPRETDAINYQGVLTQNFFVEAQGTEKEVGIFAGGDPNGGNAFIDWTTFYVYNNYWWDAGDVEHRSNETAAGNLTYVLGTQTAGTHNLEGGVQYVNSITDGLNKQSPTGINVIGFNSDFVSGVAPDGQPLFTLRPGETERWKSIPLVGGQEVENTAFYAQDTFTMGKWRAEVGVRYDDYQGSGPLPQFNMGFDDVAPRLGLAYNISDKWQVVATYGVYVSRLNDNVVQGATNIGNNPSIDHSYTGPLLVNIPASQVDAIGFDDSQWQTIVGFSGPEVQTGFLADNITAPSAEDRTLSLRYQLPRNSGTFLINWVHRSFEDLLDQYIGGVCDFDHFTFAGSGPCPAANTVDIPDGMGGVAGATDALVWANNPQAKREYEGLSFEADYRPSARWNLGGSYTFSELVGNYEGEGPNLPSNGSGMGDYERAVIPGTISPFGYMDEDIRHRVRAWGQYRFDLGRAGKLATSLIYRFSSGQRYSLTAAVPRASVPEYITETGNYTAFFSDRGEFRFDDNQAFDFGVRYDLPIFNKLGLWVKASVLNVLNEDALLTHNLNGVSVLQNGIRQWAPAGNCGLDDEPSKTCTGFGRIASQLNYQTPRSYFFQLGLKY